MGGTCGCGRSVSETLMDEFWKNLKFRKLTPKEYELKIETSKESDKEEIKKEFTYNLENTELKTALTTIYSKMHTDKYFFISLLFLLNNHENLKEVFVNLDSKLKTNLLTETNLSKENLTSFYKSHLALVSRNGIPPNIADDKIKLVDVYNFRFIDHMVSQRVTKDLTLEEFINTEAPFLKNDTSIRDQLHSLFREDEKKKAEDNKIAEEEKKKADGENKK